MLALVLPFLLLGFIRAAQTRHVTHMHKTTKPRIEKNRKELEAQKERRRLSPSSGPTTLKAKGSSTPSPSSAPVSAAGGRPRRGVAGTKK